MLSIVILVDVEIILGGRGQCESGQQQARRRAWSWSLPVKPLWVQ